MFATLLGGLPNGIAQEPAPTGAPAKSPALPDEDVTLDLQQRLNEAAARVKKGLVQLPSGRFSIKSPANENSALVLPAGVRLEGAGRSQTILRMADNAFGHLLNAPYGNVEIANLTIDGNAANRQGQIGHNLRIEGDDILVENLGLINSASYAIGVGQRRYARNVLIRNVEIRNAGADGIDTKNKLARTENIRIHSARVDGFARRLRTGQAAVDLRGRCHVENIVITDVPVACDGLRFRHGIAGKDNGPGAHGSRATGVRVSGSGAGTGIAVVSRDIELAEVSVTGLLYGLFVGDDNLVVQHGTFNNSSAAAIYTRTTQYGRPQKLRLVTCSFRGEESVILNDIETATFSDARFEACTSTNLVRQLTTNTHVVLERCFFSDSCRHFP